MIQHPFHNGNNGGNEFFPEQNEPNSQLENSNKRSRNQEVNTNPEKSTALTPASQRSIPSSIPVNRGTTHIFYKTRMCQKFLEGTCRNGDSCTFAHGSKDLREPPPNWQDLVKDNSYNHNNNNNNNNNRSGNWNDDQKIIHRMRICRKFYNGDECPYGEKCNFLHESPDKFRGEVVMDNGRTRENSVINIQTVVDDGQSQNETGQDSVSGVNNDQDGSRVKGVFWKTRICGKWETTGECIFGDKCHFAHGSAELNTPVKGDMHPDPIAARGPTTEPGASGSVIGGPVKQGELKGFWKIAHKKLNGVYADWIHDEDELN